MRAMLDVIDEARREDSDDVPPQALLRGLHQLVPCDVAVFSELDLPTRRHLASQESGTPYSNYDHGPEAYWQWRHQYPTCLQVERHHGDTSVVQLTDFMSFRELRNLGIYSEYFCPIKTEMIAALPTAPGRTRVFMFLREQARPFSELERLTLELLRPHLYAVYLEAARRQRQPVRLTPRELEVMRAIANGLSTDAIARQLVVTSHTVRKHLENTFRKLGVSSRTEAIARLFPTAQ
ncbi:helix-turn-helix domain-containing protein [Streptomyces sp. NBC_01451]|uniref:helix-turn-helix domain-containing protein n=1 Tax=Streptomyces sp. NBC_01451 TaxID=2903872 RepID=UPI002E3133EF|nr:helix-turn-helix transcriptional regulator [Streptomyces sp. NBC_01451]